MNSESIAIYAGKFGYNDTINSGFSILMLGIMPYVSAYVLVEIMSLCIPYLKKLRAGSLEGRIQLKRFALMLALPMAALQAQGIISGLEKMDLPDGIPVLTLSGPFEYLILLCLLLASFYLLVGLTELITRFGIGHGISIILLSGLCSELIDKPTRYFEQLGYYDIPIHFLVLSILVALILGGCFLLTGKVSIPCYHEKDTTPVDYFQLNLAPSSREPIFWAASVVMLPLTLFQFLSIENSISDMFHPGSVAYNLATIFFIFTFSYLFSRAFLHSKRRLAAMRTRGWHLAEAGECPDKFLLRKQYKYTLPWTIYLCILALVPSILILSVDLPFFIGGESSIIIVAICLDLICGFQFYKHTFRQPIKIAEFHDIYDANMIKNHVEAIGITCHLRGYHHRILSYFFGPHIDMSLIIDDQDKANVQTLIQEYYGGLGLSRTR